MNWLVKGWYQNNSLLIILRPFSFLYYLILGFRRVWFKLKPPASLSVPVIVIGNLTVGGTGKTPLVIYLANQLRGQGYRVGIISRGYRSHPPRVPYLVDLNDDVALVGDEAKLTVQKTHCPMVIDPRRYRAAKYLINNTDVNLILSDDGLQHLSLPRAIEIIVVDGERQFGNGCLLPSGPLREPIKCANDADFVIVNQGQNKSLPEIPNKKIYKMNMQGHHLSHYRDKVDVPVDYFKDQSVTVITAIGNPERLIQLLESNVGEVEVIALPDHHIFNLRDFEKVPNTPVIMTEKDATKCEFLYQNQNIILDRLWVLETTLKVEVKFTNELNQCISQLKYE